MNEEELHELLIEREWRKCGPDFDTHTPQELADAFEHFCGKYVYIRFPGKGKILFKLRPAQRETVEAWLEDRMTVALKARQIGFSTLVSIFCLWLTFFYDDRTVILISKAEREAKHLLRHARYALKFFPPWMTVKGPHPTINQERIEFTNDSVILSAPSASDPARGMTAFTIVVDEFGQLPNDQDAWASIEPVASVGGRIIMLGTANGEGNLFHDTFVNAKGTWTDRDGVVRHEGTGTNNFRSVFHGWWSGVYSEGGDIKPRDDEWWEYTKRSYSTKPHLLAQEFPSNPMEAFRQSGRPVFDQAVLNGLEVIEPVRGWLDFSEVEGFNFVEGSAGPLRVWTPPREGHRYMMGVDVAEGLEHGDYSSVHVIDAKTRDVVAHWHGRIDADLLGTDVVMQLGGWFNQALALVEVNNHGLVTLTAMKREGYFPIYRQRRLQNKSQLQTDSLGWRTTAASKPVAIDELNALMRDGDLAVPCSETIAELRTYRRDDRGRMEGSPHDDRVMSLAIAAQGYKYVHNKEYRPKVEATIGSVKWHLDLVGSEEGSNVSDLIGEHSVAL